MNATGIYDKPLRGKMEHPDITHYLKKWHAGMYDSLDELFPAVYQQLRGIARKHFSGESAAYHTLQPTVLVNEAYCRMQKNKPDFEIKNRAHFFALAGRVMRQILVDHARGKNRLKRGGEHLMITLSPDECPVSSDSSEIIALHEALNLLEKVDERMARIVELRFFSGLTMAETGEILNLSERTIKREWRLAKAWLHNRLKSS